MRACMPSCAQWQILPGYINVNFVACIAVLQSSDSDLQKHSTLHCTAPAIVAQTLPDRLTWASAFAQYEFNDCTNDIVSVPGELQNRKKLLPR